MIFLLCLLLAMPVWAGDTDDACVARVEHYVNVRKEPSAESESLGKLYRNGVGTVLDEIETDEGTWYRIRSGQIFGYISADYLYTGEEAQDIFAGLGHQNAGADLGDDQAAIDGRQETNVVARSGVVQEQDEDARGLPVDGGAVYAARMNADGNDRFVHLIHVSVRDRYAVGERRATGRFASVHGSPCRLAQVCRQAARRHKGVEQPREHAFGRVFAHAQHDRTCLQDCVKVKFRCVGHCASPLHPLTCRIRQRA